MANIIQLVIEAKSRLGRGFAQANQETRAFTSNLSKHTALARTLFKDLAVAALGVGAAIATFAGKALKAYSEEERVTTKLREAHRAYGEEIEKNIAREKKFAAVQQELTGIDDEKIVSGMAAMRMLGVHTDALEDATRAMIGFMYAGMDENEAALRTAKVYDGNYDRLNKIIPALQHATSETQKAAIVNAFLTRNYQQQQAQVKTLGGAWESFKNAVSDSMEEVGKRLSDSGVIQTALVKVKELVTDIATHFSEWVHNGGLAEMLANSLAIAEKLYEVMWDLAHIKSEGDQVTSINSPGFVNKTAEEYRSALASGMSRDNPKQVMGETERADIESFLKYAEKKKKVSEAITKEYERRAKVEKWINDLEGRMRSAGKGTTTGVAPSATGVSSPSAIAAASPNIAARAAAREEIEKNHAADMKGIENRATTFLELEQEIYEAKRANLEKYLTYDQSVAGKFHDQKVRRALEALKDEHDEQIKNIEDEAGASLDAEKEKHKARIKGMKKEDDPEDMTPEETTAQQKKAIAGVASELKEKNKLHEQVMSDIEKEVEAKKRNVEEVSDGERRAQEKKLQRAEQGMQRELRHAEDLARMHVSDFLQQQRGLNQWKKREKNDDQRADRLRSNLKRMNQGGMGGKLSKQDQQFLEAHDRLAAAKAAVPKIQAGIKLNQDQRDKLAVDGSRSMDELLVEQKGMNKNLKELLAMR